MYKILIIVFFCIILIDNYVLSRFIKICPLLATKGNLLNSIYVCLSSTFILSLTTAITYPIYSYFFKANNLWYLRIIIFIILTCLLIYLFKIITKKYMNKIYELTNKYLLISTIISLILGITILLLYYDINFINGIIYTLVSGFGLIISILTYTILQRRIAEANPPKLLKGLPITIISMGIIAVIFIFLYEMLNLKFFS